MVTATRSDSAAWVAQTAELAQQLRVDSIRSSTSAGSGHPTSSMSAAELMAVLVCRHLRYDWDEPGNPNNDHLIFSKGHASPLLYSIFKAVGVIADGELMAPATAVSAAACRATRPRCCRVVDVATGSLGQGLPVGVGIALAGRYLDRLPYRVWGCSAATARWRRARCGKPWTRPPTTAWPTFTAIVDVNRLGQRGPTELGWDLDGYGTPRRSVRGAGVCRGRARHRGGRPRDDRCRRRVG